MIYKDNLTLIEELKMGKDEAYIFLVNHYHRRLYAYALTLIDEHSLAQDIVQNVFLRTWQFREKLNGDYSLQSFLYKSVYHEFVNTYKRNKMISSLEQEYLRYLRDFVDDTDESELERLIAIVTKEIKKLPPRCKTIFEMSKREGLTNMEISEYLGISIKTVEGQITKAYGILRAELGDKFKVILFMIAGYNLSFDNEVN